MAQTIKVRVAEDGTLTIPPELVAEMGVGPEGEVEVISQNGTLVLRQPREKEETLKLSEEERARLRRMQRLLEETFAEADWEEIHAAREDPYRCF